MKKVFVKPEALQFLNELVEILVENEYFGFLESSLAYVNRIYDFILYDLPDSVHYKTPEALQRYGNYYVKLKSNKRTMWYVFFNKNKNRYLVKYITNNHVEDAQFLKHF